MDAVSLFLIAVAAVLLLGALGEVVFQRIGVPQPVWLILCGLSLGPVFGLVPRDDVAQLAPFIAAPALVTVIAELGFRLQADTVARGFTRAGPLAALSFVGSSIVVTLACVVAQLLGVLPESWGLSQSLLLGVTLGPACALITTPTMVRSRLDRGTTQSLELESALGGGLCVLAVAVIIAALDPSETGLVDSLLNVLTTTSIGLGLGLLGGVLWFGVLYALQAPSYAYPATLAALLVLYVVVGQATGSGAIAVLIFAVVLANAPSIARKLRLSRPVEVRKDAGGYRKMLLLLVRSSFFLFVGLLLGPPWDLIGLGVLLALLLFPARLPAVLGACKLGDWKPNARPLMALSMPRGMLAGALALLPIQFGIGGAAALPIIVFTAITLTIAAYAIGFPLARKRLGATDVVELDVDGEIGASPVSIVTPDETSRRALMPSSVEDVGPPTSRSPQGVGAPSEASEAVGPLPPPRPPPPKPPRD